MTHADLDVPALVSGPETSAGTAHALVLAPRHPRWDEERSSPPVTRVLTDAGLRVTVVDTLSVWDEEIDSWDRFVTRWQALLAQYGPIDLLCGNALGGAIAQALLPDVAPHHGRTTRLGTGPRRRPSWRPGSPRSRTSPQAAAPTSPWPCSTGASSRTATAPPPTATRRRRTTRAPGAGSPPGCGCCAAST
ncbi:hypothetical protein LV779_30895 [Streptomyces thinghirensis]|nr:hypothetical protein [Streptomyces thinghirensis]